jgi:hypothetical protein
MNYPLIGSAPFATRPDCEMTNPLREETMKLNKIRLVFTLALLVGCSGTSEQLDGMDASHGSEDASQTIDAEDASPDGDRADLPPPSDCASQETEELCYAAGCNLFVQAERLCRDNLGRCVVENNSNSTMCAYLEIQGASGIIQGYYSGQKVVMTSAWHGLDNQEEWKPCYIGSTIAPDAPDACECSIESNPIPGKCE